ncbi:hypothetical protein [Sporofaciens sp. SGI.106]|uniref:hypothetical protein n=1 Tax=Sporofaciens sp. SGI.106 TaxID=3420568 RepID=UPI003D008C88
MNNINSEFVQFPPLRRDTDIKVIEVLWEYLKMPEESQKVVSSVMKEMYECEQEENKSPLELYQKLPTKNVMDFQNVMEKIMLDIIREACDLACWVFWFKFVEGWSVDEMVNAQENADKFIIVLDALYDEFMEMSEQEIDDDNITS